MSSIIQLLPDHVANQIAAGEVVQRPASVVKELIENAVDAKATDIKLIAKDAGKTLIQVIDNGVGMSVTDARLCFERHATSKIKHAEDLFAIHTKGFRGEALASVASIAHVEMKTKQAQDDLGTHIVIEGGKFTSQEPTVTPIGTSFAVKNLFFNIPARRNFLKSENVELRHVIDEFQRVALTHPNIHFTFIHNGSEVFNLPASNLRQRIVAVFGGKTNEKLVPIQEETEIVKIHGFVSKPEFAKKNRGEQFFFVNQRFIKSGYLHHAVMSAYEGLLRDASQPAYFIYLEVPPHTIDINIHPTKTEIKFDDEHALYAILRSTVKHSLGQFNVSPVLDFERDPSLDVPYNYQPEERTPLIQVDTLFNPFETESKQSTENKNNSYRGNSHFKPSPTAGWESMYVGLKQDTLELESTLETDEAWVSGSLFNDAEIENKTSHWYQLQQKYIICPIKSSLTIINQQRAHQRVMYEMFLNQMTVKQGGSQQLLFPLSLYFNAHELSVLKELQPALHQMGYDFKIESNQVMQVFGIPVRTQESEVSKVFERLIHELNQGIPESSYSQNDFLAKSLAKSLAIKNGTYLSSEEIENLVHALFACKDASVSPFQKPVFITISVDELDKKFNI
jgi:DNA mismatch repair protein MutL